MGLKSKTSKLIIIFLIASFLPVQLVQASEVGTFYSYSEVEPTIDGVLEEDLWKLSRKLDIDLYNLHDQSDNFTISVMSIYSKEYASITFALEIPDSSDDDDYLFLVFKTNTTDDLVKYKPDLAPVFWHTSSNNDIKEYSTNTNIGEDAKSSGYNIAGQIFDPNCGGTNDVLAAAHQHNGSMYSIEFMTKLDSGDVNGADISLSRYDTVDFFIMYYRDDFSKLYTQIRIDDQEWDYCVLKIGKPGLLGPEPWFIVTSLISTLAVFSNIKRKK
ncbi:MAG: hypothetical protein ACTSO7_11375 [Candidatus Heimdallarchaeota archaeon]